MYKPLGFTELYINGVVHRLQQGDRRPFRPTFSPESQTITKGVSPSYDDTVVDLSTKRFTVGIRLLQVAKNASAAAEGLCTWVRAMKFYHEASKIVKPKLEALAIAEGQMDAANKVR